MVNEVASMKRRGPVVTKCVMKDLLFNKGKNQSNLSKCWADMHKTFLILKYSYFKEFSQIFSLKY